MSDIFILYSSPLESTEQNAYYDALVKLMDFVDNVEKKTSVIYILRLEKTKYKIYDQECVCIFTCETRKPELLLEAVIKLLPKKIVLLNSLGKGMDTTLLLLFNCIGDI